ncbi:MAG TPA: hypothetical protein DIT13_02475 [Verrucomicrobiales bacterium]|nr:hypothetical protein [Verrucomicrobiales bacterium]HRJ10667.1 ParB/RepB/Spo0J family partition protein [Prosthecobacter sp.]HRK16531.1 ParB/RepB/Spo0J family partition protein [Prosthecobacter sp.]
MSDLFDQQPEIERLRRALCAAIAELPQREQIHQINQTKIALHEISPFKAEPVDCVLWFPCDDITANDYNPNRVAPPEMKLLERSIEADGYTQPIVAMQEADKPVKTTVDGFHRGRIGKESKKIRERVHGHLPVVLINKDLSNRMAATIRHNRARGTHDIGLMSGIVAELVDCGMGDAWIMKNIGMDADELLRLKQITGLAALFKDQQFSKAWE